MQMILSLLFMGKALMKQLKNGKYMPQICEWFQHNDFKANRRKFDIRLSPFKDRLMKIIRPPIKESKEDVLLGVISDSRLTFKEHKASICS